MFIVGNSASSALCCFPSFSLSFYLPFSLSSFNFCCSSLDFFPSTSVAKDCSAVKWSSRATSSMTFSKYALWCSLTRRHYTELHWDGKEDQWAATTGRMQSTVLSLHLADLRNAILHFPGFFILSCSPQCMRRVGFHAPHHCHQFCCWQSFCLLLFSSVYSPSLLSYFIQWLPEGEKWHTLPLDCPTSIGEVPHPVEKRGFF